MGRSARRWMAGIACAVVLGSAAPAQAVDDAMTIGHVEPSGDDVQILVSVPEGSELSLDELTVTIAGEPAQSTADLAAESDDIVSRTTILAIDTSNSMARRGRFDAAKQAAETFLDTVPDDISVGIVTFDSGVETALAPSLDRDAAVGVLGALELARDTRLNDGVIQAVGLAGDEGQRLVLVLSDGRDTSETPDEDVTAAISAADVSVDVVALDQTGDALAPLEALAAAGGGSVIASDADALTAAFASQASSLARQLQVTATIPASVDAAEATVEVSVPAADGTLFTASTFSTIQGDPASPPGVEAAPSEGLQIPESAMYGGVAALGVGLMVLLGYAVIAATASSQPATVEQRIAAYGGQATLSGSTQTAGVTLEGAKDAAASVLRHNRGLEARIEARLEAAGSALKSAEWLLMHGAIIVVAGLVGMLLTGSLITAFLCMAGGLVLPWLWLGRRRKKRIKAFNAGLADTLQLMSGSLSAGLSLAQSIDTVVREGNEPIAGEFKRALVETRLGVSIEDALEGIATRIGSDDFGWVVMAIRIQREVGGNLAELLTIVGGTLRERDYLRRQVHTLSAEGRLSAYILGGLPPGVMVYLILFRREYIEPLFTDIVGIVLLFVAACLLGMAAFIMSRIVKVEV